MSGLVNQAMRSNVSTASADQATPLNAPSATDTTGIACSRQAIATIPVAMTRAKEPGGRRSAALRTRAPGRRLCSARAGPEQTLPASRFISPRGGTRRSIDALPACEGLDRPVELRVAAFGVAAVERDGDRRLDSDSLEPLAVDQDVLDGEEQ
jgi:hypothetical protein